MKHFICMSLLLLFGTSMSISFAARPAALPNTEIPGLFAASGSDGTPAVADDDFGGRKKKKKKKKKSGHAVFQHGAGISLLVAPANAAEVDNQGMGYGISYFPSVQLKDLGDHSLRFAVSPTLWFNFNSRSDGPSSGSLLLDLPAALELHLGDPTKDGGFGGHLGAGFAYSRMAGSEFGANTAYGPHFSGGARWNMLGRSWGVRAGFLLNIKGQRDGYGNKPKHVFSVGLCAYL